MSPGQPMGRGVVQGRFESRDEVEARAALAKVDQATREVERREFEIANDPTTRALVEEAEAIMEEAFLATEKGKLLMEIFKRLKKGIDLDVSLMARNVRRKLVGSKISSLIEE